MKPLKPRFPRSAIFLLALFLVVIALTIFSSSLPDGLEWTARHLGISHKEQPLHQAPLADYMLSRRLSPGLNQIFSGLIGAAVVFLLVSGIFYFRKRRLRTRGGTE